MNTWFNWRTVVGSTVLAVILAGTLFLVAGKSFALSGLGLFFAITTVISMGMNMYQLIRDRMKYRMKYRPLNNQLIGVHNDLKNRGLRAYQRQLLLTTPEGMAADVNSLRLEFFDFTNETNLAFNTLREHVVAIIHTLDPNATSSRVFRAADFGLNEQERAFNATYMKRYTENVFRQQPDASTSSESGVSEGDAAQS
jgi:hypothetical protein